jgi:uncharacterized repeat protein (TIGR03803 family)
VTVDDAKPNALIQAADGNFYGMARGLGESYGSLFCITPAGAFAILHVFSNGADGGDPYLARLVEGNDGYLYGTTRSGGGGSAGIVFRTDATGVITPLYNFSSGNNNGTLPQAGLVQGADGNLYGTAFYGGVNGVGTVFKVTFGGLLAALHSFASGYAEGAFPEAALVQGGNGYLYGTTTYGGVPHGGLGVVYRVNSGGSFTVIHSFTSNNTGNGPSELVQGRDGNFYGTAGGGASGDGLVFTIAADGTYTIVHSFSSSTDLATGGTEGLTEGFDGNFYGVCGASGVNGYGAIYRITPGGVVTRLHRFNMSNGQSPRGRLVQARDGSFYGTTEAGGTFNRGTVFRFRLR